MQESGMFVISKSFKALKFFNLMDFRLHSFARKKKPSFESKPLKRSFFYCIFPDAKFSSGWFPSH
jgi:hypothetical protein